MIELSHPVSRAKLGEYTVHELQQIFKQVFDKESKDGIHRRLALKIYKELQRRYETGEIPLNGAGESRPAEETQTEEGASPAEAAVAEDTPDPEPEQAAAPEPEAPKKTKKKAAKKPAKKEKKAAAPKKPAKKTKKKGSTKLAEPQYSGIKTACRQCGHDPGMHKCCPVCKTTADGVDEIEATFGFRSIGLSPDGETRFLIPQTWCRADRLKKSKEDSKK